MFSISFQNAAFLLVFFVFSIAGAYAFGRFLRWSEIRRERKDAAVRSRSVILGEVYEKIAAFLPDFPYRPKDMVFLGKGVDYVVFDGLSEGRVPKIVFLEIKSGTSRLNKNETLIRTAVESWKAEFRILELEGF